MLTIFMVFLSSSAYAYGTSPSERLVLGVKQIVMAPLELGKKTAYYSEQFDYSAIGISAGIAEGGASVAKSFLSGFVRVLTFPFDVDYVDFDL